MGSFCDSESLMYELLHRVLHDTPPQPVDLVYLYGQSPDNECSVLERGAELVALEKAAEKVAIFGMEKGYGYNGGDDWQQKLLTRGIDKEKIIKIPPVQSAFPPCTDFEADALIAFIKSKFDASEPAFGICASPLHQARAFVSTVSAMTRANYFFKFFNIVGERVNWMTKILHSQGTEKGTRKDLLRAELAKLNDYSTGTTPAGKSKKLPALLSAEEILDYLNQRDPD